VQLKGVDYTFEQDFASNFILKVGEKSHWGQKLRGLQNTFNMSVVFDKT